MKQFILISSLLLCFCFHSFGENKKAIGKVKKIKGLVYQVLRNSNKKILLKKGSHIYSPCTIKTSKNNHILIQYFNGSYHFVPANTQIFITVPKNNKHSKLLKKLIKMMAVGSVKAFNHKQKIKWESKKNTIIKKLNGLFKNEKYKAIVLNLNTYEKYAITPKTSYILAYSLLKMGALPQSIAHFKTIIHTKQSKYYELAVKGLLICYLQNNEIKKAKELYEKVKNRNTLKNLGAYFENL